MMRCDTVVNLLEQQASNRRRTWLIVGAFVAFFAFLGYGFDRFYLGAGGAPVPIGTLVALGVGSISALAGYYRGDRAVLAASGAIPVASAVVGATDDQRLRLRQLDNVVEEMAIAAGLPKPGVYVVPDADPNAFATGRDPAHASVAVTTGLLDLLSREELQGVVAHELSHVRNLDIRLLTVIAALAGAVVLLSDWARRGMRYGGTRRVTSRGRGKNGAGALALVLVIVWVVAVILAPLVGQALAMAVSRKREYLADASGAELTRNPGALASALARIDGAVAPTKAVKRGSAHLCIADPLGRRAGLRDGFWPDLMATHPPMKNRIAVLRQMAYQGSGIRGRGTER